MTGLPAMDPDFVAAVLEALPGRLRRRLDSTDPENTAAKNRAETEDWKLTGNQVPLGTATVTLDPPGAAECDCLLSPRCLHLARVLLACPASAALAAAPELTSADQPAPEPEDALRSTVQRLSQGAVETLELTERFLDNAVHKGTCGLSATDRALLLRVISAARVHRLYLLASAAGTLHGRLRGTLGSDPAVAGLADLSRCAQRLRFGHETGSLTVDDVGTARRDYRPVGTLRMHGWACEPILTDSGFTGVSTHLVDESDGAVWELTSIRPDFDSPAAAYRGPAELGELASSHRELVGGGLLLVGASGSADRRLGRGRGVRASLRTPHWRTPAADQWWQGRVQVLGRAANEPTLLLDTEDGELWVGFTAAARTLGQTMLRRIAGSEQPLEVRLRARRVTDPDGPPWLLLAVRPAPGDRDPDPLWLFPGLDEPDRMPPGRAEGAPVARDGSGLGPAAILHRWRDAVARQGRTALIGTQRRALDRDVAWLRANVSDHRADALAALGAAGESGTRGLDGGFHAASGALRTAWLRVVVAG